VAFRPKPFGDLERIDVEIFLPGHLIASLMELPVVATAEGNGELVTGFETQGSG
jgi:hypothetical protein